MKYEQSTVRRVASFVSTRGKEIYELKLDFSFNLAPWEKIVHDRKCYQKREWTSNCSAKKYTARYINVVTKVWKNNVVETAKVRTDKTEICQRHSLIRNE